MLIISDFATKCNLNNNGEQLRNDMIRICVGCAVAMLDNKGAGCGDQTGAADAVRISLERSDNVLVFDCQIRLAVLLIQLVIILQKPIKITILHIDHLKIP